MKSKCPYIRTLRAGDESLDSCSLLDDWCILEGGLPCPEWITIQREWARQEAEEKRLEKLARSQANQARVYFKIDVFTAVVTLLAMSFGFFVAWVLRALMGG